MDYKSFLQPPHQHNLVNLGEVLPPLPFLEQDEFQSYQQALFVSLSIMFASLKRQRELYAELVDLHTLETTGYHSFNAIKRTWVEIIYFEDETLPDWRHKARHLQAQLKISDSTQTLDVQIVWLAQVTEIVRKWWEESHHLKRMLFRLSTSLEYDCILSAIRNGF
jgi:hypothetical protein